MDLELVLTTILTWMRVNVQDAQPWVLWAGCIYAVYGFFRGNWVVLRDAFKVVRWTSRMTGLTALLGWGFRMTGIPALASSLNAWRKRPSKYALLMARLLQLEQSQQRRVGPVIEVPVPVSQEDVPGMPPVVTAENKDELQAEIDRVVARNQERAAAELRARTVECRRDLDGGLARNQDKAREVFLSNVPDPNSRHNNQGR